MRDIVFRGKRTDNGKWIEGYYAKQSNHACFAHELKYTHFIYRDVFMDFGLGGLEEIEVVPETVGQYTGLTDKNGKKIFEDDIVKIKGKTRYIFYGCSGFRHTNYGEYADTLENVFSVVDCEVIGNKIDNPELLRGDTE